MALYVLTLYVGKHNTLGSFIRYDVICSVFIRSDVIRSDVIRCVIIRSVGESIQPIINKEYNWDSSEQMLIGWRGCIINWKVERGKWLRKHCPPSKGNEDW